MVFQESVYAQRVASDGGLNPPTGIRPIDLPRSIPLLLLPNTPNPFGTETNLTFELSQPSDVTLEIYDVNGRRVFFTRLRDVPRGVNQYSFDSRNQDGQLLPSGVYFAKMTAGRASQTRKIVIAR